MDKCSPGEVYDLDPFIVNANCDSEVKVKVHVYPVGDKGNKEEKTCNSITKKWTSIYLTVSSKLQSDVFFHFQLSILDSDENVFSTVNFHKKIPITVGLGSRKFIRHEVLKNPYRSLLPENTLTISCRMQRLERDALAKCTCDFGSLAVTTARRHLAEDFSCLIAKRLNTDVELAVEGKIFQAHKAILSARSPVFAAMFQHAMQESQQNRVDIPFVKSAVFQELLQFMYTGQSEKVGELTESLLPVADKYGVQDLKSACEDQLRKKLTVDNAIRLFIMSDIHTAKKLKESAIIFINSHPAKVHVEALQRQCRSHDQLSFEKPREGIG